MFSLGINGRRNFYVNWPVLITDSVRVRQEWDRKINYVLLLATLWPHMTVNVLHGMVGIFHKPQLLDENSVLISVCVRVCRRGRRRCATLLFVLTKVLGGRARGTYGPVLRQAVMRAVLMFH